MQVFDRFRFYFFFFLGKWKTPHLERGKKSNIRSATSMKTPFQTLKCIIIYRQLMKLLEKDWKKSSLNWPLKLSKLFFPFSIFFPRFFARQLFFCNHIKWIVLHTVVVEHFLFSCYCHGKVWKIEWSDKVQATKRENISKDCVFFIICKLFVRFFFSGNVE